MKKALLSTLVTVFIVGTAAISVADAAAADSKGAGATAPRVGTAGYLIGNEPMTPQQRGDYARDFVKKWGPYYDAVYRQPVDAWAQKQARVIGTADTDNLRSAMAKTTLEAAMMTLRGHQVTDDQAIDFLARQSNQRPGELPAALGDLAKDLVYTPLTPCRVFDTRVTGAPIGSGSARAVRLYLHGASTGFETQGGQANTDCGLIPAAAAVALNVAAPLSEVGGFLTVYPFNTARPLASSLDYKAGELKNNEVVAKTANSTFEVSVYAHGRTHVVVDVVGYYAAPVATALECTTRSKDVSVAANGGALATITCPAGYTATGAAGSWPHSGGYGFIEVSPTTTSDGWNIYGLNQSSYATTLRGYTTCCRVPGR